MDNYWVNEQLPKLLKLINCSHLEVEIDFNVPSYLVVWKLWGEHDQIGQVEARFGSPYSDEPDGFAVYVEGHNWTDYCPTIEECAKQHFELKHMEF